MQKLRCAQCGRFYIPKNARGGNASPKFCGGACRQKAYRRRVKDRKATESDS